ncbi:hypothetical protein GCM10009085_20080 [Pseudomonas avellanae]|nr:hypothetical protein GCM10009085_20080 [Pseudomonas avellanae]
MATNVKREQTLGLHVPGPMKNPAEAGFGVGSIGRLALLNSLRSAAALRRKSHIVGHFYPPPESLGRGSFGVGRV